mmetsp:Transcript_24987/g.40553  ORF Transcript_24987/g.40553 Transcript_24987/m.40553 type:complete len:501 (-) Transcript_24987:48-1550(-)
MSNLAQVLAIAEASQKRERRAVEELKIVQKRVLEEQDKNKEKWKQKTKSLKAREKEIYQQATAKATQLQIENDGLKQRIKRTELDCARMRERLAKVLKGQASKQDEWHGRIDELEQGIKALISSTTEAIQSGEQVVGDTSCKLCIEKSTEIDNLREEAKQSQAQLHEKLKRHSDFVESFREMEKKQQITLQNALGELREKLVEADTNHSVSEEISAMVIKQVKEENKRLQIEAQEAIRSSRELAKAAELNYSSQVESTTKAMQVLRELLDTEKVAFADYRERSTQERDGLLKELNGLREQIHKESELGSASSHAFLTYKEQMELGMADVKLQLKHAKARIEELSTKLIKYEQREEEGLDVVTMWRKRQTMVKEQEERLEELDSEVLADEMDTNHTSQLILVTELQYLRKSQAGYKDQIEALERDKNWLRKERDAIAEGLFLQQRCVQDQLKVIHLLRESLEDMKTEKSLLMKHNIEAFNAIKDSFEVPEREEKSFNNREE